MSHLIVDIKHSLLDLLVDLLGCVDERLTQRQDVSKTQREHKLVLVHMWVWNQLRSYTRVRIGLTDIGLGC